MNKVFQEPWHSFTILPNVSVKYCSMSIVKTSLMYRICITKRPREILQRLTDFWIKKNDILRLFECLELSQSTACYQRSRYDRIVALCIVFEKTFQPMQMQRYGPIIWAKANWTSFDNYTRFSLSTSPSQTRVMGFIFCATAIFTEICRYSSWKMLTFIELFWLCSWNNWSYLQTKGWCMAWCKSNANGVRF